MKTDTIINPIPTVMKLLEELDTLGYHATLIGGTALIIMGSDRVTKDADFLMIKSARDQRELIHAFYRNGFEIISKISINFVSSSQLFATILKLPTVFFVLMKFIFVGATCLL